MFDRNMVRVYNHMPIGIALPLREGSIWLRGCEDPDRPVMETVTFADLEYIHTHTGAIRNGMVEFNEEDREEIYEALHFRNWGESCFFEKEIDGMLLNSSMENMERVISIQDITLIDRIYAHMRKLIASGRADVSSRVEKVVEARRKELYSEIFTSRIRLVPKAEEKAEPPAQTTSEEVARLVAEQVEKQMALLRKRKPEEEKTEAVAEAKPEPTKKPVAKKAPTKKAPVKKTTEK